MFMFVCPVQLKCTSLFSSLIHTVGKVKSSHSFEDGSILSKWRVEKINTWKRNERTRAEHTGTGQRWRMKSILQTWSIVNICSVDDITRPKAARSFGFPQTWTAYRTEDKSRFGIFGDAQCPAGNTTTGHAAWWGRSNYPKIEPRISWPGKRSREAEKACCPPHRVFLFFLWNIPMRLFLHFSEVIRIACESLSMYQNIHSFTYNTF